MSCTALGAAIGKATAGSEPGRHTEARAQAMKDVLFALSFGRSKKLDLDPALRVPLATALADYAPDLHEMLADLDSEYVMKAGLDTPPWGADGTSHLSVHNNMLRQILHTVAEDPAAYAVLRMAETRTAAGRLAAVPADATGAELSLPPTKSARALGIPDGMADAVTSQDTEQAQRWRGIVVDHLLHEQATLSAYQDDPAGRLTATWLQELKNTTERDRAERRRTQGLNMARTWTQACNLGEQSRQGLLAKVESSALNAYRQMKP